MYLIKIGLVEPSLLVELVLVAAVRPLEAFDQELHAQVEERGEGVQLLERVKLRWWWWWWWWW